jgi:nucleotide-binding universal stress UspA family protein
MFKQILVATDGSELGDKALAAALTLGRTGGGNVTVLTVSDPVNTVMGTGGFGTFDVGTLIDQLEQTYRAGADRILAAAREKATAEGMTITTLYLPDHLTAHGIVKTAEERGSDLIVMGSHGRRGLGRLLLGSQAAEVLSHSDVPVLVVK